MGWKSIHWAYTEYPQRTRFERYADDSWMLLIALFRHVYIAFKGQPKWKPRRVEEYTDMDKFHGEEPTDACPLCRHAFHGEAACRNLMSDGCECPESRGADNG